MRRRVLAALMTLQAFVPVAALARDAKRPAPAVPAPAAADAAEAPAEDENVGAPDPGESGGAEVVDAPPASSERPDKVRVPSGKNSAPGEVHTVVKGDTLWDLSQRYLGTPWYWPKVWSYNPEIANPHWIYPGNLVRFGPAGEEVPTQIEVGSGTAGKNGPSSSDDEVSPGEMVSEADLEKVHVSGKIGYQPHSNQTHVNQVGFVTSKELDESGHIDSSFSERDMLSAPDTVYLSFKNHGSAKVGDRYVVFKTLAQVDHPITGAHFGFVTQFLGSVKVLTLSDGLVTAVLVDSWDEIRRGDLIGPYGEQLSKAVSPRPNERELTGFVAASLTPDLWLLGEHHLVVVDRGSADGVQVGNTFTVIRQGDRGGEFDKPSRSHDARFPTEPIASCMAVDVKEKATTCLLTRSLREVEKGDRVEMRARTGQVSASLR